MNQHHIHVDGDNPEKASDECIHHMMKLDTQFHQHYSMIMMLKSKPNPIQALEEMLEHNRKHLLDHSRFQGIAVGCSDKDKVHRMKQRVRQLRLSIVNKMIEAKRDLYKKMLLEY